MKFDEFLKQCTACGGNWSAMLMTGVKRPAKGEKAKSPKSLIYWAFRGFLPKGANSEK